jgi:hypothetical protein
MHASNFLKLEKRLQYNNSFAKRGDLTKQAIIQKFKIDCKDNDF